MKAMRCCIRVFLLLASSATAFAAPFLVSDPYPPKDGKLTKFLITIDGKTAESAPAKNADGSVYLKFDLGGLPDGIYTAVVTAVSAKGTQSSPATYSFKKSGSEVVPYTSPVPKQKRAPSRNYPGHLNRY